LNLELTVPHSRIPAFLRSGLPAFPLSGLPAFQLD